MKEKGFPLKTVLLILMLLILPGLTGCPGKPGGPEKPVSERETAENMNRCISDTEETDKPVPEGNTDFPPPDTKDSTWTIVRDDLLTNQSWIDGRHICLKDTLFTPETNPETTSLIPAGTEIETTFSSSTLVVWINDKNQKTLFFRLSYNGVCGYARINDFITHLTPEGSTRYGLLWEPLPAGKDSPYYKIQVAEYAEGTVNRVIQLENTAPRTLSVSDIDGNGLEDILVYCRVEDPSVSGNGTRIYGRFPDGYSLLFTELADQRGLGREGKFLYRDTDGDGIRDTLLAELLLDEPGENEGEFLRLSRKYIFSREQRKYLPDGEKVLNCKYEEYINLLIPEKEKEILHDYGIH